MTVGEHEIADEVMLGFCATTALILWVVFFLATRNLKEMAHHIAEHHKMSREKFATVEALVREVEERLRKLVW